MTEQEKTELVSRANQYFESDMDAGRGFCDDIDRMQTLENRRRGLTVYMDTLEEHDLFYSLEWGYQDEEHLKPSLRQKWMGGPKEIMVSRNTAHISGASHIPSLELARNRFRLLIQDMEEVERIEIPLAQEEVPSLKDVFDVSSQELRQMVNGKGSITREYASSSTDTIILKQKLKEAGVIFQAETELRKVDRSSPLFTLNVDLEANMPYKDFVLEIPDSSTEVVADTFYIRSFLGLSEGVSIDRKTLASTYLNYAIALLKHLGTREVFLPVDLSDQYVGGVFVRWDWDQLVHLSYGWSSKIEGHSITLNSLQELVREHFGSFERTTYWTGKHEQLILSLEVSMRRLNS